MMKISPTQWRLSPRIFLLLSGFVCFLWALIAWLSVIPNQDILADAVQVQSLFSDPRIVLSFPGQKHAGPIEYPFQILAEYFAPGNFYVHTLPRVFFAFFTGFFTAKLYLQLFPNAKKWAFLIAITIGPTIIQGLSGPAGNTVGNWWLVGNYDTSWLLVVLGAYVLTKAIPENSRPKVLLSGLLVGLGFFAHPNITILIIPLGTLTLLILRPRLVQILWLILAFLVGIVPALFSYLFFSGNNTWDPSHPPFFVRDFYLNALGLNGIPDYISVVLPYALGLPPSQTFISGSMQSGVTWIVLISLVLVTVIGWLRACLARTWPPNFVIISTAWLGAVASIMLFVTFVDTVWFYATSLAILFWLSIGVLPTAISPRWLALTITTMFLTLEGFSMVTHNWYFYSKLPNKISEKMKYQELIKEQAQTLLDSDIQVIYGSYLDVIPIAYGSSYELRPISNRYNRFPFEGDELIGNYRVAIKLDPTDLWGEESLEIASENCEVVKEFVIRGDRFGAFACGGQTIN